MGATQFKVMSNIETLSTLEMQRDLAKTDYEDDMKTRNEAQSRLAQIESTLAQGNFQKRVQLGKLLLKEVPAAVKGLQDIKRTLDRLSATTGNMVLDCTQTDRSFRKSDTWVSMNRSQDSFDSASNAIRIALDKLQINELTAKVRDNDRKKLRELKRERKRLKEVVETRSDAMNQYNAMLPGLNVKIRSHRRGMKAMERAAIWLESVGVIAKDPTENMYVVVRKGLDESLDPSRSPSMDIPDRRFHTFSVAESLPELPPARARSLSNERVQPQAVLIDQSAASGGPDRARDDMEVDTALRNAKDSRRKPGFGRGSTMHYSDQRLTSLDQVQDIQFYTNLGHAVANRIFTWARIDEVTRSAKGDFLMCEVGVLWNTM